MSQHLCLSSGIGTRGVLGAVLYGVMIFNFYLAFKSHIYHIYIWEGLAISIWKISDIQFILLWRGWKILHNSFTTLEQIQFTSSGGKLCNVMYTTQVLPILIIYPFGKNNYFKSSTHDVASKHSWLIFLLIFCTMYPIKISILGWYAKGWYAKGTTLLVNNIYYGGWFRTQNSELRHSFIWPIMFTITYRLSKDI